MTQELFDQIFNSLLDMNIKYHEDTLSIIKQLTQAYPDCMKRYNDSLPNENDFKGVEVSNLQLQLLQCKIKKAIREIEF